MTPVISFTIPEAWGIFLSICGGLVTISAAASVIIKIVRHFRKPNLDQNEAIAETNRRIDRIETRTAEKFGEYDTYFKNDKVKIESIEEGNKFTQRALLALLSHNIDGNNKAQMEKARNDLQEYLIER